MRASLLVLTALALLGPLGGCGGGSDSDSTAGTAPPTAAGETSAGGGAQNGGASAHGAKGAGHGSGDGQFEGAEEQVEKAGSEAEGSERTAVIAAEREYLSALVAGDYARACSRVAHSVEDSLQAIVASGSSSGSGPSCATILSSLVAGSGSKVARQQLAGKVVRVRIEGDQGNVIFHAPGARLFVFPMLHEAGGWRAGAISASVLAPSAATLNAP